MNMDLNWSTYTYRLDQIDSKFDLPCVVQVSEGIYRETEAESFSAGDIIKIDKHTRIPKVAANFAENPDDLSTPEARAGISNILKSEIFVPLNYKGKVKVVSPIKDYLSVKELVKDFPRYAVVKHAISVEADQKQHFELKSGTIIELDRVIPGSRVGKHAQIDQLVIRCDHKGVSKAGVLKTDKKGRFQTRRDHQEYTIKEVVERFPLPQTVHFLKNDLQKIYMDSLVDMAENIRTYTDTLNLKRLVSQEVLIGHYKPLDNTETLAHRTVVVLPIDASYVRDIEVNVLEDATEEDYEKLKLIPVPPKAVESVTEMIYVDFDNSPGFINLNEECYDSIDYDNSVKTKPRPDYDVPPPRPPKPKKLGEEEPPGRSNYIKMKAKKPPSSPASDDDYLQPTYPDLAGINFDTKAKLPRKAERAYGDTKESLLHKMKKLPSKLYSTHKDVKRSASTSDQPDHPDNEDSDEDNYEKIDPGYDPGQKNKANSLNRFFPKRQQTPSNVKQTVGTPQPSKKPTAFVTPCTTSPGESVEEAGTNFDALSIKQAHKRLIQCGMRDFAEICRRENLDGNFIATTSVDVLKKDPFNLNDFDIMKLERVKKNWIPK